MKPSSRPESAVDGLARQLETDIKPLLAHLSGMASEAARAAALATAQVERLDRLFGDLTRRAEQTFAAAQQFMGGPAREGVAVVAGIRAAFAALKSLRESARRRSAVRGVTVEDDESLFIG
ncbi:MAG: hypothetical protein LC791_13600 [Acidobacteria bacterium]|nr:hypothetical protein [Acidobacteriota bacterium]